MLLQIISSLGLLLSVIGTEKCPKSTCPTSMIEFLAKEEPVGDLIDFLEGTHDESVSWGEFAPIPQYGVNKHEESWRLFQSKNNPNKTIFLKNILGAFNTALAKHAYTLTLEEGQTGIKGRVIFVKQGEGEVLDPQSHERVKNFVSNYLNKCVDEEFTFFVKNSK